MDLLLTVVDFVREHGTELSVGIGALRLTVDTVRGIRSLLRRRARSAG
ncbi:hypothetical protein [Kitasatospora sp. NPDC006786]